MTGWKAPGTPNLPTTDGVTYNSLPVLLRRRARGPLHEHSIRRRATTSMSSGRCRSPRSPGGHRRRGEVTFRFYAADNQIGYLFNSHNYGRGNEPLIHVVATPLLRILSGTFTNDGFLLIGAGNPNTAYQVQASSAMPAAYWELLGTAVADGTGTLQFTDLGAATNALRFYRLAN